MSTCTYMPCGGRFSRWIGFLDLKNNPIPPDKYPMLYERMTYLHRLVDRVETQVKQFLPQKALLLADEFPRYRAILSPSNWDAQRSSLGNLLNAERIKLLSSIAQDLPIE